MYDLPSLQGVKKCIINKEVIEKEGATCPHLRRPAEGLTGVAPLSSTMPLPNHATHDGSCRLFHGRIAQMNSLRRPHKCETRRIPQC